MPRRSGTRGLRAAALLALFALLAGPLAAAASNGEAEPAAAPALQHAFGATLAQDFAYFDVEACLDPATPAAQRTLLAEFDLRRHADAPRAVVAGRERVLRWQGERFTVPTDASCVRYRVDLERAAREGSGMRRPAVRVGRDLKTSVDLWLLRPTLRDGQHVDIDLHLPPGMAMSAPWSRLPGEHRYRITRSPDNSWGAVVAFGRFTPREILLADGARLELAVLDGNPAPDEPMLARWITDIANEVGAIHGQFPSRELQVVLVPLLGNGLVPPAPPGAAPSWHMRMPEAVGFGRILRDGGNAAELQVVQTASEAALRADWTASHEFSHLLLPYLSEPGSWISEGFADYYQNLLMARSGRYTEAEAWRRLVAGFERGRGDGSYAESLEDALLHGGENQLMRRYWTGAVVALLADVALRRQGDSLDAVLGRLSRCCLPSAREWTTAGLFARLDALAGRPVFAGTHDRWLETTAYPDYAETLRLLGVRGDGRGVTLDDRAPLAAIRRAIMQRRAPARAQPVPPASSPSSRPVAPEPAR